MKKVLLFISMFVILPVLAYETVIIKYPDGELWEPVYYKKKYTEAIAQYVLSGQTSKKWTKTVIIHSYTNYTNTSKALLGYIIRRNMSLNPTSGYRIIKNDTNDAIAYRCTNEYKLLAPQCEILRAARGHSGIITIHYINKNIQEFENTYMDWYERIKKAVFYESYYRNDRILNKAVYMEL